MASGKLKPCRAFGPKVPYEDLILFEGKESPTEPDFTKVSEGPTSMGTGTVPPTISTGCSELDRAWASYASMILNSPILIPDTDEDLTWHAFLGHSIDMQGFRAAEFAGVDPLTRNAPKFVPLKTRGIGVPELASLLGDHSHPRALAWWRWDEYLRPETLAVLRAEGGDVGRSLAEAFEHFPGRIIAGRSGPCSRTPTS